MTVCLNPPPWLLHTGPKLLNLKNLPQCLDLNPVDLVPLQSCGWKEKEKHRKANEGYTFEGPSPKTWRCSLGSFHKCTTLTPSQPGVVLKPLHPWAMSRQQEPGLSRKGPKYKLFGAKSTFFHPKEVLHNSQLALPSAKPPQRQIYVLITRVLGVAPIF